MYTLPAASMQGTGSTVVPVGAGGGRVVLGVVLGAVLGAVLGVVLGAVLGPALGAVLGGVPVAVGVDVPLTPGVDTSVDPVGTSVGVPGMAVPVPAGVGAPHSETGGTPEGVTVGGDASAWAAAGSAMARTPSAVATAVHLDAAVIDLSFCAAGSPTPHEWSCHQNCAPAPCLLELDWQWQAYRPAVNDGAPRTGASRLFR
jgi:hypothetical protein